jgi:hypothetical protein
MLDEASLRQTLTTERMDSSLENYVATCLRATSQNQKLKTLCCLLSSERVSARVLGLRVVRRVVRERGILDEVVCQAFQVERYAETEAWYQAILARYPVVRLARRLRMEIDLRQDRYFQSLHTTAVQMCRVPSRRLKKLAMHILEG